MGYFGVLLMPVKAVSAAAGTGLAGAIVTILLAFFGAPAAHGIPPEVFAAALTTVVGSVLSFLGAYLPNMENK